MFIAVAEKITEKTSTGMPYSSTQRTVHKVDLSPFRIQIKHVNAWGAGTLKNKECTITTCWKKCNQAFITKLLTHSFKYYKGVISEVLTGFGSSEM